MSVISQFFLSLSLVLCQMGQFFDMLLVISDYTLFLLCQMLKASDLLWNGGSQPFIVNTSPLLKTFSTNHLMPCNKIFFCYFIQLQPSPGHE